ncbi:MAG: glycosyltransferase [Calditrichia bacterium]
MPDKPLQHILLIVPGFPENEQDTTCIPALQSYVRALANSHPDIQISIISMQYPFARGYYMWNGIDVYSCGGQNRGKIRRLWTWAIAMNYIRNIQRKKTIDLIHSFWLEETSLIGQHAARFYSLPHVASVMGQDARSNNRYLKRLNFERFTSTAGSANAADALGNRGSIDAIIPIGLQRNDFPEANTARQIHILGVGALTELKNYQLFVELIDEIRSDFNDLKCVLIGDGPERKNIEQLVADKDLNATMKLMGHLPRKDVLQHMADSLILLHTSSYESQGYVFNEALYSGMRVICFDVGAANSPKTHLCLNRRDMLKTLREQLQSPPDTRSIMIQSIDETIRDFVRLYRRPRKP